MDSPHLLSESLPELPPDEAITNLNSHSVECFPHKRSTNAKRRKNQKSSLRHRRNRYHYDIIRPANMKITSIKQLLRSEPNNIHDTTYTNVSANDFKVIIGNTSDCITPACSVQCICDDRIKLYLKNYRFQLSNLTKHLKTINHKSPLIVNNKNQDLDDPEVLDQTDLDDPILRSEK
ncbi:unnamed protein product [Rotaria magnacalcarata]|nr:unnamed protein product [Rotaria magnacalcarata]